MFQIKFVCGQGARWSQARIASLKLDRAEPSLVERSGKLCVCCGAAAAGVQDLLHLGHVFSPPPVDSVCVGRDWAGS